MQSTTENAFVFEIGSLYQRLQTLTDSRKRRGVRYSLATILLLALLAKLSGEDQPRGIAEWAAYRTAMLTELLQLPRQAMPHHSTYRRIFADVLDVEEWETLVSEFLTEKKSFGRQVLVALDGKVLRGTLDEAQQGTYLLAAYLPQEGLVLLEIAVEGKGKEIPGALTLLKKLDVRGKVVMGDALHPQRPASAQICTAGGDYVWYAKGNQGQLEEDIRLWFAPEPPNLPGQGRLPKDFEQATQVNKGHGRLERRQITVSSQLNDFLGWPFLKQVFKLERQVTTLRTGQVRTEVVYGLTSLARQQIAPQKLLTLTRQYWGIENGLHYRRDVTLQEDRTHMTQGRTGHVMACLNNLVLGLLIGKRKFAYLPSARRFFNANLTEALALVTRL